MTEQEMWEAVQRSDASYDGLVLYAVRTTGIFCRSSCKSKPPKRENLCYFASGEEARVARHILKGRFSSKENLPF